MGEDAHGNKYFENKEYPYGEDTTQHLLYMHTALFKNRVEGPNKDERKKRTAWRGTKK